MPIHDWTRVEAGIFHAFHHSWVAELHRALNRGLLPNNHYALTEPHATSLRPDVILNCDEDSSADLISAVMSIPGGGGGRLGDPKLRPIAETDMAFYRRKQNVVAVRHVRGDRIVAMIEIVSPGNKAARNPLRAFVQKAAELLDRGVHLLIIDLHPPGKRDPDGIHNEIWQEVAGQEYALPPDRPLTLAAYETGDALRAYVEQAAVGDRLTDMPLFLEPGKAVAVPLEATYNAAFAEVPRRWRRVLEAPRV